MARPADCRRPAFGFGRARLSAHQLECDRESDLPIDRPCHKACRGLQNFNPAKRKLQWICAAVAEVLFTGAAPADRREPFASSMARPIGIIAAAAALWWVRALIRLESLVLKIQHMAKLLLVSRPHRKLCQLKHASTRVARVETVVGLQRPGVELETSADAEARRSAFYEEAMFDGDGRVRLCVPR